MERLCSVFELVRVLQWRFIACILLVEFLMQGIAFGGGVGGLIGVPIFFLLRLPGTMSASRMQVLKTIATTPWAMKPLFGILSDTLYLGGYNKMPYMLITLIGATLSCLTIALTWPLSPEIFTLLLVVIFLAVAVIDLLLEAMYVEKMAQHPQLVTSLVSFYHMVTMAGEIVALSFMGLLVANLKLHYIYLLAIPIFLALMPAIYYGWHGENERANFLIYNSRSGQIREHHLERNLRNCLGRLFWFHDRDYWPNLRFAQHDLHLLADEETFTVETPVVGLDSSKFQKDRRIFALATLLGLLSLVVSGLALAPLSSLYLFVVALVTALLVCMAFYALVDAMIARLVCYTMLVSMFSISLESAAFLFYTDTPEQFPAGPHFSVFFYVTVMGLVGCFLNMMGTWIYSVFLSRWRYRSVLFLAGLFYAIFSLANAVFYSRLNQQWGLSDYVFILGAESVQVIVGTWTALPISGLMIQLCPRGVEATMYALLAGAINLGRGLSHYQSAFIMDSLNITPSGAASIDESEKFRWLWLASLISSAASLLPLLMIPVLIPDAEQGEKLLALVNEEELTDDRDLPNLAYSDSMSASDELHDDDDSL